MILLQYFSIFRTLWVPIVSKMDTKQINLIAVGKKKKSKSVIMNLTSKFKKITSTVALIYFRTLRKWSAILGLSFSAWCWLLSRWSSIKFFLLRHWYMMHLGLPTTEHVLVLLYDAHKTCTLPGHFGVAGLKLGRIGQNKWESATSVWILEKN